jgi:hypothetical protein
VLALEHGLHAFRGTERYQRLLEPTLREAQKTSRLVHDQLRAGLAVRLNRPLRSVEPPLGLIESPEPQQCRGARGEAGNDDRILAPPVVVGDPHRLLAELKPSG